MKNSLLLYLIDLEISDLINCSPNLNARTPGQLLSLTSHLSFGSEKKLECGTGTSHFINTINKHSMYQSLGQKIRLILTTDILSL